MLNQDLSGVSIFCTCRPWL